MRRTALFCLLFAFLFLGNLHAQHVYPEKFDHCYLDEFKYEETSIIAQIDYEDLKKVVTEGWDSKMLKGAEGNLGLQILVDRRGKSCLMSVRNDTNLKMKKMNLEENINNHLQWKGQSEKISVIMVLNFEKGEISIKRLGTKDMINLVEIDN